MLSQKTLGSHEIRRAEIKQLVTKAITAEIRHQSDHLALTLMILALTAAVVFISLPSVEALVALGISLAAFALVAFKTAQDAIRCARLSVDSMMEGLPGIIPSYLEIEIVEALESLSDFNSPRNLRIEFVGKLCSQVSLQEWHFLAYLAKKYRLPHGNRR